MEKHGTGYNEMQFQNALHDKAVEAAKIKIHNINKKPLCKVRGTGAHSCYGTH